MHVIYDYGSVGFMHSFSYCSTLLGMVLPREDFVSTVEGFS